MKKFLASLLTVFSVFTFCSACKSDEQFENSATMLSSFESYYDVQKIALQNFTGRVDFEDDEKFTTEGEGSARITFLYETETPPQAGAQISKDKVPYIAFRANVYENAIKNISDFQNFILTYITIITEKSTLFLIFNSKISLLLAHNNIR